jgi:hypothetical protein
MVDIRASQPPTSETDTDFITAFARSQTNASPHVEYESAVKRAPMAKADCPVVKLPPLDTCLDCPFFARRFAATLVPADQVDFSDTVVGASDNLDLPPLSVAPPKILAGIDLADGPHVPVKPGFEDYARVIDPIVLADALYLNQVLPACACTRALFDAADKDTFSGLWLDFLRQEAALKANCSKTVPASAS